MTTVLHSLPSTLGDLARVPHQISPVPEPDSHPSCTGGMAMCPLVSARRPHRNRRADGKCNFRPWRYDPGQPDRRSGGRRGVWPVSLDSVTLAYGPGWQAIVHASQCGGTLAIGGVAIFPGGTVRPPFANCTSCGLDSVAHLLLGWCAAAAIHASDWHLGASDLGLFALASRFQDLGVLANVSPPMCGARRNARLLVQSWRPRHVRQAGYSCRWPFLCFPVGIGGAGHYAVGSSKAWLDTRCRAAWVAQ